MRRILDRITHPKRAERLHESAGREGKAGRTVLFSNRSKTTESERLSLRRGIRHYHNQAGTNAARRDPRGHMPKDQRILSPSRRWDAGNARLAAEARYYHSFFLAESSVSFDEFQAALSRELSSQFPGVTLNSNWIRACDQRGLIAPARRDVSLLRASIEHQREFSVGVWELLWKITGTYIGKLGLRYAELKTSESELQALAQRYLAAECRKRLRALDTLLQFCSLAAVRRMFDIVDDMLHGVLTSLEEFAAE